MATIPGPDPDKPLPRPGAPAIEPEYEPEEAPSDPGEDDRPEWLTEPYDPSKEYTEPEAPVGVP